MSKLTIVIPVYNNANFTKACLQDLSVLPNDHEIVLVDNGSTDSTQEVAKNYTGNPKLNYIRLDNNTGFAHACNVGFNASQAQHVMFLNNDIRVKNNKETWTQPILECAKDSLVGPTGGLLDSLFNFIKETDTYIESSYFYMSGWNLTSSVDIWKKLDISSNAARCEIFSEEFGLAYFEDTDLGFRARKLNIPMKIVSVPVIHFGKMTSKKLDISSLYLSSKRKFIEKWKDRI